MTPLERRVAAWRALAAILARAPSSEMRDGLADGVLHALLPEAADDAQARAALDQLATAAAADPGDPPRRLAAAFAGLFLGAGGPRSALPFASAYHSPSGRLFQEPAVAMTDLLRRADRDLTKAGEAPDHVAVQLALLADLLEQGDAASLALAKELREAQLLPWLPEFAADCARFDGSGLYAQAAFLVLWLARQEVGHAG